MRRFVAVLAVSAVALSLRSAPAAASVGDGPLKPLSASSPAEWVNAAGSYVGSIPSEVHDPKLGNAQEPHDAHGMEPEAEHVGSEPTLVSAGTVPVYEYYSSMLQDHMYTLSREGIEGDAAVTGGPKLESKGWIYKGIAFFVSSEQQGGQVPLLVYFSLAKGDHALTTNPNRYGSNSSYRPRGTLGFVYAKEPPSEFNAVPVYSYFDRKAVDHFYSTHDRADMDANEPESISYEFRRVAFYAPPGPFINVENKDTLEVTGDDPIPVPDPDTPTGHRPTFSWEEDANPLRGLAPVPLYRYQSKTSSDSLITDDYTLLREGAAGWALDGTLGKVFKGDEVGTTALHRYYNARTRSHFYTVDGREVTPDFGWTYLGAESFVYADKPAGIPTVALRRFWNKLDGSFWFSVEGESTVEKEKLGYELEKVACYVITKDAAIEGDKPEDLAHEEQESQEENAAHH